MPSAMMSPRLSGYEMVAKTDFGVDLDSGDSSKDEKLHDVFILVPPHRSASLRQPCQAAMKPAVR